MYLNNTKRWNYWNKCSYWIFRLKIGTLYLWSFIFSSFRYIATYYTLGRLRTLWFGKAVCLCIWVVSLVLTIPYWLFASLQTKDGRHTCRFNWVSKTIPPADRIFYRTLILNSQLAVGLVIPFICICASYFLLVCHLRDISNAKKKRNKAVKSATFRPRNSSVRCRVDAMTLTALVIVLTFVVCQLPYYILEEMALKVEFNLFYHKKSPTYSEAINYVYFNVVAQILVFVSSCCNPVFYGLLNKNYSKFMILLCGEG